MGWITERRPRHEIDHSPELVPSSRKRGSTHPLLHAPSFMSQDSTFSKATGYGLDDLIIRRNLQIPTVKEEIRRYSSQYSARLSAHPNDLTVSLIELSDNSRLRRHLPNDLATRFLV
jgi:hypothetical protein